MTAENWIKTFNARFNKVFDRLFDIQGFFLTKLRTSEALCMVPAALNSALFSLWQSGRSQEIKAALRPGAAAPRVPGQREREGPHPGNQGKHKHSRRGRNWKRYQVCGHGNMSPSPAPSTSRGLQTLPQQESRKATRCFCSVRGITVPLTANDTCFYLGDQKHVLELHPSAQGGLQVSRRSLSLNIAMDLFH